MSEPSISADASADGGKKKSKKLFVIIGLVVLLLAGGAGGYFFFFKSSAVAAENKEKEKKKKAAKESVNEEENAEAAKHENEKSDEKESKDEKKSTDSPTTRQTLKAALPDDSDVKQVVELQPFIINLADTDEARYLRLAVSLGIGGEGGGEEKPSPLFMTRVKNAMLAVLSVKKSDEVLSVEGKAKLRKELLQAAQAASEEPKVEAIYITDFIVQL